MFLCADRNYLFAGRGAGPVVELTSLIIRSFRVAAASFGRAIGLAIGVTFHSFQIKTLNVNHRATLGQ